MEKFNPADLKKLYRPVLGATKGENGQVTIIGGSSLFHGALILTLKVASRIVDMVFFASPEPSVGKVAEKLKSYLCSFIWVPWEETEEYIKKSDAILIGPGMMRSENSKLKTQNSKLQFKTQKLKTLDKIKDEGLKTYLITKYLLQKYSQKQWVIDAGSLQMMRPEFIPRGAILTPNQKELTMLFKDELKYSNDTYHYSKKKEGEVLLALARKYQCIIVAKGPETVVYSPEKAVSVGQSNEGLTKGGTGDVLAGLTVALVAKNPPFLAACVASFIVKKTADELYKKVGFTFSADDLAEKVPEVLGEYFH